MTPPSRAGAYTCVLGSSKFSQRQTVSGAEPGAAHNEGRTVRVGDSGVGWAALMRELDRSVGYRYTWLFWRESTEALRYASISGAHASCTRCQNASQSVLSSIRCTSSREIGRAHV